MPARRIGTCGTGECLAQTIRESASTRVRLVGGRLARGPVAFAFLGVVIEGAADPRVVGDLMVVPHGNERKKAMRLLQIRIGPIGRVARAIVSQRDRFSRRLRARD